MAKDKEGRQRGTEDSFTGRAAQLAVMAELLRLGCTLPSPKLTWEPTCLPLRTSGRKSSAFR